jgi:hypothetical protein
MNKEVLYSIIKELLFFIFVVIMCANGELSGSIAFIMLFMKVIIEVVVFIFKEMFDY